MKYSIGFLTAVVTVMAQDQSKLEDLRAEIEALKPPKLVWKEIPWKTCPLEALKESREQKKPVIIWVFLGNPSDERC
jgi:hypothetical protein